MISRPGTCGAAYVVLRERPPVLVHSQTCLRKHAPAGCTRAGFGVRDSSLPWRFCFSLKSNHGGGGKGMCGRSYHPTLSTWGKTHSCYCLGGPGKKVNNFFSCVPGFHHITAPQLPCAWPSAHAMPQLCVLSLSHGWY